MLEKDAYQQIKEKKTLQEVLQAAIAFEKTARDFYQSLLTKVSKPLRGLVLELAQEEQRHYELFTEMAQKQNLAEILQENILIPKMDHRFSDYIQTPKLSDFADDQAILQYALGREQAAMEQYRALAKETPESELKDLFLFLAIEEQAHKSELEKRYYTMVYT